MRSSRISTPHLHLRRTECRQEPADYKRTGAPARSSQVNDDLTCKAINHCAMLELPIKHNFRNFVPSDVVSRLCTTSDWKTTSITPCSSGSTRGGRKAKDDEKERNFIPDDLCIPARTMLPQMWHLEVTPEVESKQKRLLHISISIYLPRIRNYSATLHGSCRYALQPRLGVNQKWDPIGVLYSRSHSESMCLLTPGLLSHRPRLRLSYPYHGDRVPHPGPTISHSPRLHRHVVTVNN